MSVSCTEQFNFVNEYNCSYQKVTWPFSPFILTEVSFTFKLVYFTSVTQIIFLQLCSCLIIILPPELHVRRVLPVFLY